ncbi:monocarboxylate transporter 14 [Leptinotarsa decemlineata]|uniref:monocarboxylate transporter 14 n=1 Tax=Leptinotarsa decemlineata TaxID=7539 RepID=UPI000C251A50|nr:monocarboxylate transporter 12-like [Leptinotarsa decemlineata]
MAKAKIARKEEAQLAKEQRPEDDGDIVPGPPDGGYGWVIVAASFICNMVVDGISYCFGICLSELVLHYGETKGTTAWVGSILTGCTMCFGPIVSAVVNKFGCRITCITGSIIGSAAFALSVFCPTVSTLMIVYGFIGGIGFGLIYLPAVVCVGYYFESKRSLATGISVCGSGFGAFAFAPLATFLVNNYGWKGTNLCFAGIILCCSIFGALMKPLEFETIEPVEEVTTPSRKLSVKIGIPRSNTSEGPLGKNSVYNSTLSVGVKNNVIQPLARKDIFYSGSVTNLKEFQSQATLNSYRQSVLNISRPKSKSSCLPESLSDTLSQLLDFSLVKDPVFMVLGISNIFGMGALYIPFVYLVESAKAEGIDASSASFLISLIGILNTVGRIIFGYIADSPKVDSFLVNNLCLIICAISVALTPFCHTYATYVMVAVGFAIGISGYISLTSIILVELLGLDKLTNAFGLIILFRGFAAFIGSPLGGALYDATQSYNVPFFVAGASFAISAAISFAAPCFKKKKTVDNDEALTPMNA